MSGAVYLILGKDGQLGRAFTTLLGHNALGLGRGEADFRRKGFLTSAELILKRQPIEAVINAAAYTQVDKAEGEGKEEALRVNAEAVGELGAWCGHYGLPLIHFSTDYVFSGGCARPRTEDDPVAPLNVYGESKLAGERALALSGCRHFIFRTSWVYDAEGKNFFTTMLRLMAEKEKISVVSDQTGAPTYAPHLAMGVMSALKHPKKEGLYHLCNAGGTSWHGFAQAIFALASQADSRIKCKEICPIPSEGYPSPAKRPRDSRLDCSKALRDFGVALPSWESGLSACMEAKYGNFRLSDRGA